MKTYMAKGETVERKWYVVDATDMILGRLSSQVAAILRGKHKPIFTPHVDTGDCVIIVNAAKVRHMSARYMLTGKDSTGADAHIYVENNGWFDDSVPSEGGSFRTVPTFYTDSAALAPYLHTRRFTGEGSIETDGLHIRFYEV